MLFVFSLRKQALEEVESTRVIEKKDEKYVCIFKKTL